MKPFQMAPVNELVTLTVPFILIHKITIFFFVAAGSIRVSLARFISLQLGD